MNTTIQLEGKQFTQWNFADLSTYELAQDQVKHFRKLKELQELQILTLNNLKDLLNNDYSFTIKVINDDPYRNENYSLITLILSYCSSKPLNVYIHKDYMIKLISEVQ